MAGKQSTGYGMIYDPLIGRVVLAHRVSYEVSRGPIPDGMVLDHRCRNRGCVNPDHLQIVTRWENTMAKGSEALAKKQLEATHCPKGHSYEGENLISYTGPNGRTYKRCRTCRRATVNKAMTKYLAKKRALATPAPPPEDPTP